MSSALHSLALLCLLAGASFHADEADGQQSATVTDRRYSSSIPAAADELAAAKFSQPPAGDAVSTMITSRTADAIDFQMQKNSSARSLTIRPTEKVNAAVDL